MAKPINSSCACGVKAICFEYKDTSDNESHFLFQCEIHGGSNEGLRFCPWCGEKLTVHKPVVKVVVVGNSCKRIDAKPGETEKQYRKRTAPIAKRNRKAEQKWLKSFQQGLAKIR